MKKGLVLWAFSCKIVKSKKPLNQATEKDYEPFLTVLYNHSYCIDYIVAEVGDRGILHYHGMVTLKRGLYFKPLYGKGFHLYMEKITNMKGWRNYCYKNDILHCHEDKRKAVWITIPEEKEKKPNKKKYEDYDHNDFDLDDFDKLFE